MQHLHKAFAEQWARLSNNLHYLLVSTCDGPASTICKQNMQGNGFETRRLIHARYSIPLGARSIGYLTSQAATIKSNMVQQRKRKEGQAQGQRKVQQRQRLGNNYSNNNYKGGKGKYNQQPVGQGNPFKGQHGYGKGKGYSNKGKGEGHYNNQQGGKGAKGTQAANVCYRCGQPGHMAKQCRVAIYNCDTGTFDTNDQTDDWYNQAHYDNNWYHQDQPQVADSSAAPVSGLHEVAIAMIGATQQPQEDNKRVSLMIDSGAATHVCPLWFASQFPLHQLAHGTGPQLRTATNQHIKLHGYRWVCMTNHSGQQIVIPFYVCEVKQPILSVTRLVEQGFQLTLDDNARLQHIKGFNSTLENRNGLFFL